MSQNNDLISRSAHIEYFERLARSLANARCFNAADAIQGAAETIRNAPAVDAEPVRHGRWIMRGGRFRCSECDAVALQKDEGGTGGFSHEYVYVKSNRCPNCGAKMDGDKND